MIFHKKFYSIKVTLVISTGISGYAGLFKLKPLGYVGNENVPSCDFRRPIIPT